LYWASRGSVLIAGCELASVAVGLCVGARDGARAELATCMVRSPGKILSLLVRTHATAQEKPVRSGSNPDAGFRNIRRCSPFGASGAPQRFFYVSGFPLRIKIYYILCSSAESTLIIVAWVGGRKPFLMHTKGAAKGSKNQRSIGGCAIAAPSIHRKLTMLSTAGKVYAKREGRRSWLTHFFVAGPDGAARSLRFALVGLRPTRYPSGAYCAKARNPTSYALLVSWLHLTRPCQ
jgi:hypothetical protein